MKSKSSSSSFFWVNTKSKSSFPQKGKVGKMLYFQTHQSKQLNLHVRLKLFFTLDLLTTIPVKIISDNKWMIHYQLVHHITQKRSFPKDHGRESKKRGKKMESRVFMPPHPTHKSSQKGISLLD